MKIPSISAYYTNHIQERMPQLHIGAALQELRDKARESLSIFALSKLATAKELIDQLEKSHVNRQDIEHHFYAVIQIHLSSVQKVECRRTKGKVTMLRIEDPITGQMRCAYLDDAKTLREAITLYAPQAQVEEK